MKDYMKDYEKMHLKNFAEDWKYIQGDKDSDTSVQISPTGELALCKTYESTEHGVKRTYFFEHLIY